MNGAPPAHPPDIAKLRLVGVIVGAVLLVAAIVLVERSRADAAPELVGVPIAGPGGCCVEAAVDDDGTARVGYVRWSLDSPQSFWSAAARPATTLGAGGRLLSIGPMHISKGSPVFAWDGRGRAVAAWRGAAREVDRSARGVRVYVAGQRADGTWTAPQTLSRPRRGARYPVLAVDRAGNAIVAWSAQTRKGWRVEIAQRSADREVFGPARAVSAAGDDSAETAVAVDGASWVVAWGEPRVVRALRESDAVPRTFAMRTPTELYEDDLSQSAARAPSGLPGASGLATRSGGGARSWHRALPQQQSAVSDPTRRVVAGRANRFLPTWVPERS